MKNKIQPIPPGYHTVTPYLIIEGAKAALEFYKKAFGATETFRMETPEGKIGHAEIRVGDSPIMLADSCPERGACDPHRLKGRTPVLMHLYVDNADRWIERAVAAGAKITSPVADQFYGDRSGMIEDPFGHVWCLSTHQEDVSPEELSRRYKALRA